MSDAAEHPRGGPPLQPGIEQRERALDVLGRNASASVRLRQLVGLAAQVAQMPVAYVSLIDRERQWFRAVVGRDSDSLPREQSLCAHTISSDGPLIVADLAADARFESHPLVAGEPHIAAYAGFPVAISPGLTLGTLAVADHAPHALDDEQIDSLQALARMVEEALQVEWAQRAEPAEGLTAVSLSAGTLSDDWYRTFFDGALDAMAIFDASGKSLAMNPRAVALLGLDAGEAIGLHFAQVVAPSDVAKSHQLWEAVFTGGSGRFELVLQRADGTQFTSEISARAMDHDGQRVIQTIVRDIDYRLQANEVLQEARRQLWQAQKMDAMGDLAGGVAHDFNNLLLVIRSCTEFLLDEAPADDPWREDFLEIRQAADRAADLTHQLLAFSRHQVLDPKPVSPDELIGELDELLAAMLPSGVALVVELNAPDAVVRFDPAELEQVLINLVANARDAVDGQGTVTISTGVVNVTRHSRVPDGEYAVLRVSDDGVGMSQATVERIFDPFFTMKPGEETAGLGLSATQGIVAQSGGYLTVTTAPGEGSSFQAWLPLLDPDADEYPSGPHRIVGRPSGVRETVLVVEDDAAARQTVVRVLNRGGLSAVSVGSARQALQLCETEDEIGLVVTDLVMPEMDGGELLRELRRRKPWMPVVLMTGFMSDPSDESLYEQADAILGKPMRPAELLGTIQRILRERSLGD